MELMKKMNPNVKKVLGIVFNVLFYAFLVILFIFAISNIRSKKNNIPNVFGVGYLEVMSGSMTGTFEKGDYIWVKVANDKKIAKLKEGDVITFYDLAIAETLANADGESNNTNLNTHRIVEIITESDGTLTYVCQGDYLKGTSREYVKGSGTFTDCQRVKADDIKAIYTHNMGKGLTNVLKFAKSSTGFAICIVLPTALLLVYEIVMLVRNIIKLNQEKLEAKLKEDKALQEEDLEEQKRKMREELLAELRAEQEQQKQVSVEQVTQEKQELPEDSSNEQEDK